MIKTLEEKKKQQKLLILAGIIFFVTFLVLYFGVLKKDKNTISEMSIVQPESGIQVPDTSAIKKLQSSTALEGRLKKINLDFDLLNNKILPFLRVHGDLPVRKGETGRINPFIAPQ